MLIVLPSRPTTEEASLWLQAAGVSHNVIVIPSRLGYRTASDIGICIAGDQHADVPMQLTKARFVVMRVFKRFELLDSDEVVSSCAV